MLGNLFSSIAAKVMLGIIVALLVSNLGSCALSSRAYSKLEGQFAKANKRIEQLNRDNGTLKANQLSLEGGLAQCNASVQTTADARAAVAAAGVKALQEVQQAGQVVSRKAAAIDAMPKETCEDAFNILKTH
jgi:predicted  nucleic acid-binding Zn-ribbon protein